MVETHTFITNKSRYVYEVQQLDTKFVHAAGNYIFGKRLPSGQFELLYVGIAEDLGDRISSHNMLDSARRLGATNILAHLNGYANSRSSEEQDLISYFQPPLNTQYR